MQEPLLELGSKRQPSQGSQDYTPVIPYLPSEQSSHISSFKAFMPRPPFLQQHRSRQNKLCSILTEYVLIAHQKRQCSFIVNTAFGIFLLAHVGCSYFGALMPCINSPSIQECASRSTI